MSIPQRPSRKPGGGPRQAPPPPPSRASTSMPPPPPPPLSLSVALSDPVSVSPPISPSSSSSHSFTPPIPTRSLGSRPHSRRVESLPARKSADLGSPTEESRSRLSASVPREESRLSASLPREEARLSSTQKEEVSPHSAIQQQVSNATSLPETADSNRELRNTLEFVAVNSWGNEAWTRSLRKPRRIAPPKRGVDEGEVDLALMIELLAGSVWCNFCAKNLYYFSAGLDPQEWLESTFERLSHLLAIFLIMNSDELRCRCVHMFATEKRFGGGSRENSSTTPRTSIHESASIPLSELPPPPSSHPPPSTDLPTDLPPPPARAPSSPPLPAAPARTLSSPPLPVAPARTSSPSQTSETSLERKQREPVKMLDGARPTSSSLEDVHDCLLLFLHGFLALDGPCLLLYLVTDLLNYEKAQIGTAKDTLALHRTVERALECIVKIFRIIHRVCTRQTCSVRGGFIQVGACEGLRVCRVRPSAASWVDRDEKVLWWMEGGVEEALLCMLPFGVPERIGITLMEFLLDLISDVQEVSYTPFHIKKVTDLSLLPLIAATCLWSKFDHLENILHYLTFLVLQKPENAPILARADQLIFIMPTLLTAGTSCPHNKLLRIQDARLAEEKVGSILRNSLGLIMSILYIYFVNVDPAEPSEGETTRPLTLCAVLFAMLDALEDTAHKLDADTVARSNVILYSLLNKLTYNVKLIKRDTKSFMWESVFQLAFAIEDHVWYNSLSPMPRAYPRHFRTFELRGTPADVALITQLDEFLALLEPAVKDDDVPRSGSEKRRIDLLRARLAEEREFLAICSELLSLVGVMDPITLTQDRRYKLVESTSRHRYLHFGDPAVSAKILPPLSTRSPRAMERKMLMGEPRSSRTGSVKLLLDKPAATPKKGTIDLSKLGRFVGHIKGTLSEDLSKKLRTLYTSEDSSVSSTMGGFTTDESSRHGRGASRDTSTPPSVAHRLNDKEEDESLALESTDELPGPPPLPYDAETSQSSSLSSSGEIVHGGESVGDNSLDPEINPKCWKQHIDPNGKVLYFNSVTKTLSSDRPPCLQGIDPPLESGTWEQFEDPNGELFYYNSLLSQISYDDPLKPCPPKPKSKSVYLRHSVFSPPLSVQTIEENVVLSSPPVPTPEVLAWREAFDANLQTYYFWNRLTNEITAECPECLKPFNVPEYWEETFDEASGRAFYFHTLTELSTYVRPSCLAELA